ncbi:MAG: alpha-amylase family glycosyl hydrolase [Caldilineaceae bacterium]
MILAAVGRKNQPRFGGFLDVIDRLDYLVELGINAIELMPVQQFPGESSWGYNPVFYFAPARSYGSPDDLMQLVDACHRRGIAVILDVVFNHVWGDHPTTRFILRCTDPRANGCPISIRSFTTHRLRSTCGAAWIGIILQARQRPTFKM